MPADVLSANEENVMYVAIKNANFQVWRNFNEVRGNKKFGFVSGQIIYLYIVSKYTIWLRYAI